MLWDIKFQGLSSLHEGSLQITPIDVFCLVLFDIDKYKNAFLSFLLNY